MTTHREQVLLDIQTIFTSSEYGRPASIVPGAGPLIETTVLVSAEQGMLSDQFGENPADVLYIEVMTADYPEPTYGDHILLKDTSEEFMVLRRTRASVGRIQLMCARNERMAIG